MTFGEKLVRLRKIKALTQDEFASAVGVSRQAVYKWESGQSYPEASKLLEIKLLFGISIDDLLDDTYEVSLPEKKKRKRISKEDAKRIEAAVREEEGVEEKIPVAAFVSSDEVAAEAVEVAVAEEAVEVEAEVAEIETAPATEGEPVSKKEEKEEEPKRVGFFGRLFGRK